MTKPAAFSADYVDLRFVKSRKVAQIIVELPIEQATAFVAAFGAPDPSTGVPVAIARLDATKVAAPPTTPAQGAPERDTKPKEPRRWPELSPAAQAGIRCGEPAFMQFLLERYPAQVKAAQEPNRFQGDDVPANCVRAICEVASRSEILPDTKAAYRWAMLDDEYRAFMRYAA